MIVQAVMRNRLFVAFYRDFSVVILDTSNCKCVRKEYRTCNDFRILVSMDEQRIDSASRPCYEVISFIFCATFCR